MHRLLKTGAVSEVMVSACMIFIMFMLAAMLMQIVDMQYQKQINAAAFTAARAAVKTKPRMKQPKPLQKSTAECS